MPIHEHLHRRRPQGVFDVVDQLVKREYSTVYEIVYTTASPTFTEPIGGYTTLGVLDNDSAPTSTPDPTPAGVASTSTPAVVQAAKSSPKSSSAAPKTTSVNSASTLPSAISYSSTTLPTTLAIAAATGKVSSSTESSQATTTSGGAASAVSDTSSSSADSASSGDGMSTAGKAGLAIGILLLLGAVLAIVLLCFRKRRKAANQERAEDEKHEFANLNRHDSTRTTATAPRLSLRPVTQFLPNLNMKRGSRGNDLLVVSEKGNTRDLDRPSTAHSQSPDNPFGNHAQSQANIHDNPFGAEAQTISPVSAVSPGSPIDAANANGPEIVEDLSSVGEIIVGAALGGAGAASGSPALKRSVSKRGIAPSPIDFTRSGPFMGPPSPSGTEFSVSSDTGVAPLQTGSGASIAAAGGPASSTVHRVQLDFKPSMEDELELRQGQLIRLLHEYDDGWALCIRLDRSRQGVVPRTCLSARPVKPRPMPKQHSPRGNPPAMHGPPRGSSPRAMTLNGSYQRPMTPNGSHMPTGPLPSTPDGRSSPLIAQSPSSSPSNSPSAPSHLNITHKQGTGSPHPNTQAPIERKPLPGQAL